MLEIDNFRFQRGINTLLNNGAVIRSNALWLDLGCHQGQFINKLIDLYKIRCVGFDNWNPILKSEKDCQWEYFQTDLDRELIWSEPADFVSALEVLEHMIDTDEFLKRIFMILKLKGWVLLSTPNINSLRNRITVPFGIYPTGIEYKNIIHHVRLYNLQTLKKHLHDIGFQNIHIVGVSFLPLSSKFGMSKISRFLAKIFPQFCNNLIIIAQKY